MNNSESFWWGVFVGAATIVACVIYAANHNSSEMEQQAVTHGAGQFKAAYEPGQTKPVIKFFWNDELTNHP